MPSPSPTPVSSTPAYSRAVILLHWAMALLIIALIVLIEAREFISRDNPLRSQVKALHFSLGLAVLGFLAARIVARFTSATPPISPAPPAWQTGISHLMHLALYALMLGLPILGWATLSALGKDIAFFGIPLPPILAVDKEFGHTLEELHKTLGEAMIWLIALHAAAALFHHLVVKDTTLVRMAPGRASDAIREA